MILGGSVKPAEENRGRAHGLNSLTFNQYPTMHAAKVGRGCILAFKFENYRDSYCYYLCERDHDARVYCLIDGTSLVFHDNHAPEAKRRCPVFGLLSQERATEDLALILLRAASKVDRRFGRYATFISL